LAMPATVGCARTRAYSSLSRTRSARRSRFQRLRKFGSIDSTLPINTVVTDAVSRHALSAIWQVHAASRAGTAASNSTARHILLILSGCSRKPAEQTDGHAEIAHPSIAVLAFALDVQRSVEADLRQRPDKPIHPHGALPQRLLGSERAGHSLGRPIPVLSVHR